LGKRDAAPTLQGGLEDRGRVGLPRPQSSSLVGRTMVLPTREANLLSEAPIILLCKNQW